MKHSKGATATYFRAGIYSMLFIGLVRCATLTTGTDQSVSIETPKVKGAACKLTDSENKSWYVSSTPGTVGVDKGNGPMEIFCEKEGYEDGKVSVEEEVHGATLGNIILGGGIGLIVDAASGAAQRYPDTIVIWMKPMQFSSEAEEKEWLEAKKEFDEEQAKKAEEEKQEAQDAAQGTDNEFY